MTALPAGASTVARVPDGGRRADTGFLLIPLAALVYTTALLLAILLGLSIPIPARCDLSQLLSQNCSEVVPRISTLFNLLIAPGVVLFVWRAFLRRRLTRPMDPEQFPAAAAIVKRVLADTALPRPVPVVLGPHLGRRAYAGGTGRRPYVALGPELLTLPATGGAGPAVFEAVLRHELAHVQNKDLPRSQLATALRVSTRFAAVMTVLLVLVDRSIPGSPPMAETVTGILLRALALALIGELVVRAFFRSREREADLRAAGAWPEAMGLALHGGRERHRNWWDRSLSWHPPAALRRAALHDRSEVLRFPLGQVLAGGLLTGVSLVGVEAFLDFLRLIDAVPPPDPRAIDWSRFLLPFGAVGVPMAIFLTVGVWRDTRGAQLAGRPSRAWLIGLTFAAGLVAGSYLVPYMPLLARRDAGGLPITLVTVLAFGAGAVGLCAWLAGLVRGPSQQRDRLPLGLLVVALVVGAGYPPLAETIGARTAEMDLNCSFAGCTWLETQQYRIQGSLHVFDQLWPIVMLALAVGGSLWVAVRRQPPPRRFWLVVSSVGAAAAIVVWALMFSSAGTAIAVDWSPLDPSLANAALAVPLEVTGMVAAALAVWLPRRVAVAVAAGTALGVGAIAFIRALVDLTASPAHLIQDLARPYAGLLLGEVPLLAILIALIIGGARHVAARFASGGRRDAIDEPPILSNRHVGQELPRTVDG